jgi:hypothetical protein
MSNPIFVLTSIEQSNGSNTETLLAGDDLCVGAGVRGG